MGKLTIDRLGFALGAKVTGVDLARPLDDGTIAEIRKAWLEHIVLCFPGQDLTPQEQEMFCSRFGKLDDNRMRPHRSLLGSPSVSLNANKPLMVNGKQLGSVRADAWHSDASFTDRPGTGNFLLAKQLPDAGGDTMFANMYMAYEALSPALKGLIEPLEGVHDVRFTPDYLLMSPELQAKRRQELPPIAHPVVRVHPETGRKTLYAGAFLSNFVGMTEEESAPLVKTLNEYATRYEFIYRHRWSLNDLVMWDNRCSMHYAVSDYDQRQLRIMQRCVLHAPKVVETSRASS